MFVLVLEGIKSSYFPSCVVTSHHRSRMVMATCLLASIFLALVSEFSAMGLYLGTFVVGFFISSEFGGCVNWCAKVILLMQSVNSFLLLILSIEPKIFVCS